jgi:HAD superfamily hydrolase (TIGR01509 family)
MFKMIKGIILDLDGVYFQNGTKNFLDKVSNEFGVNRDLVAKAYLRSSEMQEYKKDRISGDHFWNFFISILGIESSKEKLLKLLALGYEINSLAENLLNILKEKGIKSIICTNNFRERISILNEKFNFVKDFDFVIFSYEFGVLKPELLEKVIEKSGLSPTEILLLDDSEVNINNAKEMGIKAELCKDPSEIKEHLNKFGIKIE